MSLNRMTFAAITKMMLVIDEADPSSQTHNKINDIIRCKCPDDPHWVVYMFNIYVIPTGDVWMNQSEYTKNPVGVRREVREITS